MIRKFILLISVIGICYSAPLALPLEWTTAVGAIMGGLAGYAAAKIDEDKFV